MQIIKCLKYLFVIIVLLLSACSSSNETIFPWNNNLSTEQNIAKNAIALENNEDFSFLDEIVKDHSIIILGEEGHYDDFTIEIKIKMIEYLKKKGFNSIVFEGAPLLTSYVYSDPKYKDLTKKWEITNIWQLNDLNNKIFYDFLEIIREKKMRFWGMDFHGMTEYDIDAIKKIFDDYPKLEKLSINWDRLKSLYFRKFVQVAYIGCPDCPLEKLSIDEQYELMRMIDTISNYTHYLINAKGTTIDLKIVLQWIRNLNTAFSYLEYAGNSNEYQIALAYRNRDMQMAENIDWILKNFQREKLILWTANFHAAKDISQTRYPTDSLLYFYFQSMGEFLYSTQGNKIYTLAFTSLLRERKDSSGSLEKEIAIAIENAPYAFINFEPLRFADGYRDKEFESNVIMKKQGKWLYIFDGLYYIRDQVNDFSKAQEKEE